MSLNPFDDLYEKWEILTRKVNLMANQLDAAIAKEQADVAALTTAVTNAQTALTSLQAQVTALSNSGVTPAQLAELAAISTSVESITAGLTAAVTPPAPPAS